MVGADGGQKDACAAHQHVAVLGRPNFENSGAEQMNAQHDGRNAFIPALAQRQ